MNEPLCEDHNSDEVMCESCPFCRIIELEAALAQAEEFRVKGVLRIIELEDERDRYQEVAGRWESQCECECDRCIELLTVLLGD